jgi:hypothetical protein
MAGRSAGPRSRAVAGWHFLVLVPLALTIWVYHPITRAFFFADDFVHLIEIVNEAPLVFLLRPFGGQAFLGRNLVFLGSYHLFGVDPVRFMWTVLLTHLLNVWLLYRFLRTLTRSVWLACLGAALWGTSPLAAGSLSWYAAFGHVLVGTVLLLVLNSVLRVASVGGSIPTRTAASWFALLLIGSTCYGPGMGLALAFPIALVLLLPAAWEQRGVRAAFLALPLAMLAVYFGLRQLYTLVGEIPFEEVLQQRIALSGFEHVPVLLAHLLSYSAGGTLLGFFLPPTYPSEATSIAVVALAAGLGFLLWRGSWAVRREALAMLALWASVYLVIATGRANMYAVFNIRPESAAIMGRYHYAGTIPLVVLMCMMLQQAGRLPGLRAVPRGLASALGLGLLVYGYLHGTFQIDERQACHDYFLYTQKEIADAGSSMPDGATIYLENNTSPPYVLGPMIPDRLVPGRAAMFVLTHPSGRLDGREVRFIERASEVRDWYLKRPGTPLGRLLVAPEDAPARP